MQPLLCPVFTILTRNATSDKNPPHTEISWFPRRIAAVGSISTALCCMVALYPARIHETLLSGGANVVLILILLIQLRSESARDSPDSISGMFDTLKQHVFRINTTLCCGIALQSLFGGYPVLNVLPIALLGSVKAFSWQCSILLVSMP
jgi:hypothetical protein